MGWKIISSNNSNMVKTYTIDTENDIVSLPTNFLGSSAICISTGSVYMLNTEGVWKKI